MKLPSVAINLLTRSNIECAATVIFDADVCTHVHPAEPHSHVGMNFILSAVVEIGIGISFHFLYLDLLYTAH